MATELQQSDTQRFYRNQTCNGSRYRSHVAMQIIMYFKQWGKIATHGKAAAILYLRKN